VQGHSELRNSSPQVIDEVVHFLVNPARDTLTRAGTLARRSRAVAFFLRGVDNCVRGFNSLRPLQHLADFRRAVLQPLVFYVRPFKPPFGGISHR